MVIPEEKKPDVLLAALSERYASLHAIRARVEGAGLWIIGLSLGAGGWLLQSGAHLSCLQKAILIIATLAAFVTFRFFYLEDLRRGFCAQQRVAAEIETALGLYSKGVYGDEPIYPVKWKDAGSKKSDGKFFNMTYLLLYVAVTFLVFAILASGALSSVALEKQ
jgi:hypothetical protein